MKTPKITKTFFQILLLVCFFIFIDTINAQIPEIPGCIPPPLGIPEETVPYKPTKTTGQNEALKILIVHVCFADDNYQPLYDNFWPPHQMPVSPNQGLPLLAPEKVVGGQFMDRYPDYTISDYFCEMSMGQLDVIGLSILVDLPFTSDYFRNAGYKRATLNKHIL